MLHTRTTLAVLVSTRTSCIIGSCSTVLSSLRIEEICEEPMFVETGLPGKIDRQASQWMEGAKICVT